MQEPRARTIRIQSIDEKVIETLKFNASSMGDCRAIAGMNSNEELFIEIYEIYKPEFGEDTYQVKRIIFDFETTQKIRILFRRQQQ